MILAEYYIEGIYLGASRASVLLGNYRSRVFYCSRCGAVFGKCIIQGSDTPGFGAAAGICKSCLPYDRYDTPGGIPFFTDAQSYPKSVLAHQLNCELEFFYARLETTVHPSGDEYLINGS